MNAQRGARGLRPFRVSRALTASAKYHSHQMGLFGFFEHESRNGAPFWRRIGRFYRSAHYRHWSVGENIFWESPDTSGPSAVHEWMMSVRWSAGHDRDRRFRRQTVGATLLPGRL